SRRHFCLLFLVSTQHNLVCQSSRDVNYSLVTRITATTYEKCGDRPAAANTAPRLLDQVRERIRYKHYSIRTERAYVEWVRRFILFHGKRHPREMAASEIEAFLSHLANDGNAAAATHHQALSALLFLYKEVLGAELPWLNEIG